MSTKKTVFLTGATGTMGSEGLKELLARKGEFNVVTLVRPSEKNKKLMAEYEKVLELRIVWGDLTTHDDVRECVKDADYVLHTAALISPEADYKPDEEIGRAHV
jgi:nucleoside-diphosphate-sugar epimerase